MKKTLISVIFITAVFIAMPSFAQVSFGVLGSFNMYNMTIKDPDGKKIETKMIPAFDAGIFSEIPIADEFYFRPELLFASKGAKFKNSEQETSIHLSYLVLPLDFLYKGNLSGGKILLGIGPYIGLGIVGKGKAGSSSIDVKFKNDVSSGVDMGDNLYIKPIDFGGNMIAGYEFENKISFTLNTFLGLSNIEPKIDGKKPESSMKNNGFGLTLGYRFN